MFVVYKTTNKIDNKIYIGFHETNQLEFDGYLGSGLYLNRAIDKYGIENFYRETLFISENKKESFIKEKEYIRFYNSQNPNIGYNICAGGQGGFILENAPIERILSNSTNCSKAQRLRFKEKPESHGMLGKTHTDEIKINFQN